MDQLHPYLTLTMVLQSALFPISRHWIRVVDVLCYAVLCRALLCCSRCCGNACYSESLLQPGPLLVPNFFRWWCVGFTREGSRVTETDMNGVLWYRGSGAVGCHGGGAVATEYTHSRKDSRRRLFFCHCTAALIGWISVFSGVRDLHYLDSLEVHTWRPLEMPEVRLMFSLFFYFSSPYNKQLRFTIT